MNIQTNPKQSSEDYLRIEQAILYLENHYKDQPELEEVAANHRAERISFSETVHPLGRGQPQALPAVSDEGRREGSAQPLRESAGYHASGRTVEPGTVYTISLSPPRQ